MNRIWKRLFIAATILLVVCSAFGGAFWYRLNITRYLLAYTEAQLANTVVELDTTKTQLTDAKTLLDTTKTQLSDTEAQLDTTKARLSDTEAQLDTTEVQLSNTEAQLGTTKVQLADTEAQLGTTKAQLSDTEAQLGTTKAQLLDTEAQLDNTRTELTTSKRQLEAAKNENSQMLNQYEDLKGQVNVRLGWTQQDMQSFITPDNSAVSAKVQEITGGYSGDTNKTWRDYERLYRWVVNNVEYSYDSYMPVLPETISGTLMWWEECWRTPAETLEAETGDCEDMAVLLASMLRNYNEGEYAIWLLEIQSSVPEKRAHLAVAFPVAGGKLTILDPAGNYYTGYPYGSLRSYSASVAVSKWLSHWRSGMPGAEIVLAFSESFYDQFSSTAEFLTWMNE